MEPITHSGSDAGQLNDVTRRSRITGTSRSAAAAPEATYAEVASFVQWGAVIGSVLLGLALTATLIIIGVATGLIAGDETTSSDEAAGILSALGAWFVIAIAVGSFVGSFVGGRMTRWMDRLSIGVHSLVGWGLATLLGITIAALVSIGFSSTAASVSSVGTVADATNGTQTDAANNEGNASANGAAANAGSGEAAANRDANAKEANETGDTLGGMGWALAVGMILSLVVSALGWFLGSRRQLTSIEREVDDRTAVV